MAGKLTKTSDSLVVSSPTSKQTWEIGQGVDFTLAANTFTDRQKETLTYSATLSNGAPLPSWLTFNPTTGTFTGTVPSTASGLSIEVTATDTSGLSASEIFSASTPAAPPKVTATTAAQTWKLGQVVNFTLPADTFTDPQHETLTYRATLSNGAALPSWLKFDAATETFTGTVPNNAAGLSIKVTATDTSGLSVSETFSVATPAAAPTLVSQTSGQTWKVGQAVSLSLAPNTFVDPQGESLTYKATLSNGTALPSWLKFNAATETFTGTVPNTFTGAAIKVTATDTSGLSASETFSVSASAAAAPVLSQQTSAQTWGLGSVVNFALPGNTFSDPQQETLTYKATLAGGTALPSWLTFNAATETFTGTVPNTASGLSIEVTATDTSGLAASETFSVATPAAAPVVAAQTSAQTWGLGSVVNFALPGNTFSDPQQEALTYTASLANGSALPSWLTFNSATATFIGTVPNTAAGLNIVVTATDTSDLSTSVNFSVATPASAPFVANQTTPQTWDQEAAVDFTLAGNTFTDPQQEGLTYTATLANGALLPSWLTFNAVTETFTGTVPAGTGGLSLAVTATDASGLSVQDFFSVETPAPAASAPTLTSPTPSQTWNQGQAVSFTLPTNTFTDPQQETLTYTAALVGGGQLPSWLGFNGATGTFTGAIPNGTNGLNISVIATDTNGLSTSEAFSVATPASNPPGVSPMRASAFQPTLGVNTHIDYTDGGYANVGNVLADLQYLGITQVRDEISNGANGSAPLSSYIYLAQQGIKFTFCVETGGAVTSASLESVLSLIDQVNEAVPGSVTAVEGPNEINNEPITFNGVGGLQGAINLQEALYADVHSDPNLVGVSVDYFTGYDAGSNGIGPNPNTTAGLADYDTAHPYPNNGQAPAGWVSPSQALPNEGPVYGPAVYTETGYSTNGGTSGAVNQDVQAKYTLDLLMDDAKNGISKTYLYQLMDAYQPGSPQGDDGFGLFDPNNQPKEAATAISNLVSILADNGAAANTFTTTPLNYSVAGLPSTGNTMLMEKSNGAYDVVVWNEPQIWNESTGTEITAPTVNVTVQLGNTYSDVQVFDPLVGSTPIETLSNVSSVQLGITDHPLIVEIEPAPNVTAQTANQTWTGGQAINFALASNTFTDPAQEALTYNATLSNGAPLPTWLAFNAATETFTGTAPNAVTSSNINVTATNTSGLSTTETFSIATAAAQMAQAISGVQSSPAASTITPTQTSQNHSGSLASPVS